MTFSQGSPACTQYSNVCLMPQSNVGLQKSKANEVFACFVHATNCQHVLFQLQGDLGRVELYAETPELHKQWLKHLLTAVGPDLSAANGEAGCGQFVETATANKLGESQAGDEVTASLTCAL